MQIMRAIFQNLLSTHNFYIVPAFRKHSRCLFIKQRHYEASTFKYASTAKFPGLIKNYPSIKNHDDLYKFSIENPETFWDYQAQELITWSKPYSRNRIMDCNMGNGHFRWFDDGQINASINCVDRYVFNPIQYYVHTCFYKVIKISINPALPINRCLWF